MAGVGQRLEIRQGQGLVMTPQLQQAIKLLQLSNVELAEYCEQELERNPLLERDDRDHAGDGEREAVEAPAKSESLDTELARDDFSKVADMDGAAHDNLYDGDTPAAAGPRDAQPLTDWTTVKSGNSFEGEEDLLESTLADGGTLKDHLLDQVSIAALPADQRLILLQLIDSVDEAGYLRADLAEVAHRLGIELCEIDVVLRVMQGFDPVGVGARDLAECLGLQLKSQNRHDPAIAALLTRLDLVARRDLSALSQLCGVDTDDVTDMIAEIRGLTPKPGLAFGTEPVQPVVPDVFVRVGADGGWAIELNSDTLPRLLVNARYYAQVSKGAARDKDAKTYLTECLNNANWLVKSLDQRARTILKVSTEIVRQQDGFLTYGVRHLRPLNLRTIADAIGMHE
jgi:RNA polymerase sigma-54 factor